MRVQTEMELLRDLPLFAGVDPAQLQILSFSAKLRRFSAGQPIIRKDETGRGAYLILSGRANVHSGADAKSPKLAGVETGSLVGELAMFAAKPYPVTVIAAQNVEAKEITRALFNRVSEAFPEFARLVFAALSGKVQQGISELDALQRGFD